MPKAYWKIEVQKRFETTYTRYLSGDLTENEITVIIQRLACRHLSEEEIISASLRKSKKTSLLEASRGGPPPRRPRPGPGSGRGTSGIAVRRARRGLCEARGPSR